MILWTDDEFLLGVPAMDDTHREFVERVNRLDGAGAGEFAALFDELLEHTRGHFEREDALMEESRFPATAEHRGEHRRVLADLERMRQRIGLGRTAMARAYLAEIPAWFRHHAATMDSALAAHLKQRG